MQAPARRPISSPAEHIPLTFPNLPKALVGKSILHLADLHIRRFRPFYRDLIEKCSRLRPDLVFFTGDYMTSPRDEKPALKVIAEIVEALNPKQPDAIFATFGNHDYPLLRKLAPKYLPTVNWITDAAAIIPELNTTILGTSTPCDLLRALTEARKLERAQGLDPDAADFNQSHFRILLGHEPSVFVSAAQFNIPWTLAGHTHGGQIRLTPSIALHTSCDVPPRLASGVLRMNHSICTISRGLGQSFYDIRLFCPTQILIHTLQKGPLPGNPNKSYPEMTPLHWW